MTVSGRAVADASDVSAGRGLPRPLPRAALVENVDRLYRAAWVMCRSREDAEDLVQETFARVLSRPRLLHGGSEFSYLLSALRNTHFTRRRAAKIRPSVVPLRDDALEAVAAADPSERELAHEVLATIAAAPAQYRDAVVAVDLMGLSYAEAARCLNTREATIATRVFRGRQQVARALGREQGAA